MTSPPNGRIAAAKSFHPELMELPVSPAWAGRIETSDPCNNHFTGKRRRNAVLNKARTQSVFFPASRSGSVNDLKG
jgi:hypothetical protein